MTAQNNSVDLQPGAATAASIRDWLRRYLSRLLELPLADVDESANFAELGLDSAAAIALSGDLERWLDCELDATITREHDTISALALHLERHSARRRS